MDMVVGSKVKYEYPLPASYNNITFIGVIEYIGESFVDIRNEQNVTIRISYKNYNRIIALSGIENNSTAIK